MKTYKSTIKNYSLVKNKSNIEKVKLISSKDSNDYVRKFYFADIEIYESFFMILLNRQNITEGFVKISQGGTSGTVVDIKLIAKYAIESLASGVIVCHNHPSGSVQPSIDDKNITTKIKEALKLLDINLLDHLIIAPYEIGPLNNKYYSFADEGLI